MVTALLCAALDRRLPDRLEMLSLLILTTGVAISMWEGTVQGKPLGMVLCMIGAVCTGLMSALSGGCGLACSMPLMQPQQRLLQDLAATTDV